MRQVLSLAAMLAIASACTENTFRKGFEGGGMAVTADISSTADHFDAGKVKIRGRIVVSNTLDHQPIRWSNRNLWLTLKDGGSTRAYVDSIASHTADQGFVGIPPGEDLELSVYWVFSEPIVEPLTPDRVSLDFAIP